MAEPGNNLFQPLFDEFRRIVREEIAAALGDSKQAATVKEWLSAKECAARYGLPPNWFEGKGRTGQIARTKRDAMCSLRAATWPAVDLKAGRFSVRFNLSDNDRGLPLTSAAEDQNEQAGNSPAA
jgi:hypothetical protein